jgi:putative redox protein
VGAKAQVEKEMNPSPRRIGGLHLQITLPAAVPQEFRNKLETAANHCPVHQSLHPEIKIPITFLYQ